MLARFCDSIGANSAGLPHSRIPVDALRNRHFWPFYLYTHGQNNLQLVNISYYDALSFAFALHICEIFFAKFRLTVYASSSTHESRTAILGTEEGRSHTMNRAVGTAAHGPEAVTGDR